MARLELAVVAAAIALFSGCGGLTTPPSTVPAQLSAAPTTRTSGGGWQLIKAIDSGPKHVPVVQVATTADELSAVWTSIGGSTPAPSVDFSKSIVAAFLHVHGSNCPDVTLNNVVIDANASAVYSEISERGPNGATDCLTDQYGDAIYVVALDRSALPASPFVVSLNNPSACTAANCQSVTVNLTGPPAS